MSFSGEFERYRQPTPKSFFEYLGVTKNRLHKTTSTISIDFVQVEPLRSIGSEGSKYEANVVINCRGRARPLGTMFAKYLTGDPFPDLPADGDEVIQVHCWLRNHGFPVIPTLRFDPSRRLLLMTYIANDNKHTIVDDHSPTHAGEYLVNRYAIASQILKTAEDAYTKGNGVFLSIDAYAIVVDRDRVGDLCLLDICYGTHKVFRHRDKFGRKYTLKKAIRQAEEFNRELLNLTL